MNTNTIKVKKGGIDTIVAFIVVLLPLVYVLIYMVATLYHFSVQMYLNQVVKETLVMASTYGEVTTGMETYLCDKLDKVLYGYTVRYYRRPFDNDSGEMGVLIEKDSKEDLNDELKKADIFGIYVESQEPSILGTVSNFNIFGAQSEEETRLKYSAYREEIIRNDPK